MISNGNRNYICGRIVYGCAILLITFLLGVANNGKGDPVQHNKNGRQYQR